jgi:hypothetical protein
MLLLSLAIWTLTPTLAASPVEDCRATANTWIDGLMSHGCPPLSRYRNAAMAACTTIDPEGWTRARKSARKALLRECAPTIEGFPGAMATLDDGRTLSHCSELLMMMREHPPEAEILTESTVGLDGMTAAVGAALFACLDPKNIAVCRLPASTHTPADIIKTRITACEAIENPPFDTTMKSLVWHSGLLAVDPSTQRGLLQNILTEQARLKAQREQALLDFKAARSAELDRAKNMANTCMMMPGEMNTVEETDAATEACTELLKLWRGEDRGRIELEASGRLAEPYLTRLKGKILNGDTYNVGDKSRIMSRPDVLKLRRINLVDLQFKALIETDVSAAEAWLTLHRDQMDPQWVANALDQVLAASM